MESPITVRWHSFPLSANYMGFSKPISDPPEVIDASYSYSGTMFRV
jgi:hypothetical protein